MCEAAVPVLIGVVINEAVATGDAGRLGIWAVVLCVHFAMLSYAYRFGSRIGFRATQVESHRLRTEVSGHVLAARGARTDRLPGDVLALATSDADMVGSVFRQVALSAAAVIGLTVSGIALATIDPMLALVVLVGVPVVLVCTQVLAPRLAHRSEERQESLGRATGLATDLVRGLRPLKGFGGEDTALARYRTQSQDAALTSVAAARWEGALYGVTQALSGVFLAAVALLAGLRAVDGQLTIGELVAVVGLAQFIAEPMGLLAYLVAQVAQSRASAARIAQFLATPPLVEVGDRSAGPGHTLAFVAVSSGSLREVSFVAEPGTMVAVMAEQPADSARLMALLCGETTPDEGDVLLAGVPLTELSLADARSRLLVAEHHVDLFAGTLRSNLDPRGTLPAKRLGEVLEASAAVDIVTTSEHGLDEPVAVNGTTLSGGQRQRVGLARAVAADPHVLVLHDPTTAVDAVTEQRIADALHALRHADGSARTTVVISSSPALLARADRVVHLRDGYVVATGSHEELAADDGYRLAVLR